METIKSIDRPITYPKQNPTKTDGKKGFGDSQNTPAKTPPKPHDAQAIPVKGGK